MAPTFLDMAGVTPPMHMDGRSFLPLLTHRSQRNRAPRSDTFLIERYRNKIAIEIFENFNKLNDKPPVQVVEKRRNK